MLGKINTSSVPLDFILERWGVKRKEEEEEEEVREG